VRSRGQFTVLHGWELYSKYSLEGVLRKVDLHDRTCEYMYGFSSFCG